MSFQRYRRTQIAEMRPVVDGEVLDPRVSVSAADREAGSPKVGDMIARNPKNPEDQWLVAADYFRDNFEPLEVREGVRRVTAEELVLFRSVMEIDVIPAVLATLRERAAAALAARDWVIGGKAST